nr:hypothetical protein [Candidatus Sigynarchaeota archaeon]
MLAIRFPVNGLFVKNKPHVYKNHICLLIGISIALLGVIANISFIPSFTPYAVISFVIMSILLPGILMLLPVFTLTDHVLTIDKNEHTVAITNQQLWKKLTREKTFPVSRVRKTYVSLKTMITMFDVASLDFFMHDNTVISMHVSKNVTMLENYKELVDRYLARS